MPSENESTIRLAKATYQGCIMKEMRLNLGAIIAEKNHKRAKQNRAYIPFQPLIIVLCKRARVPRDAKKEMGVTPTYSTNIRKMEGEYLKDPAKRKKKENLAVTKLIPAEASLTTPAPKLLGTPSLTATLTGTTGSSIVALSPRPTMLLFPVIRSLGHS
ncbi:hypothetical protein EJD97_018840 [Solanum chilense]|uniref:Putative plant transposon protein domain-containing protein n=1 Tax=Solanum chilense TaxID=4083 RepID=A0A6N2B2J5_SOLCI|nr:hypothetical protein EJD97_018840 [Solanum chilense]